MIQNGGFIMMSNLISKQKLQLINRKLLKYSLATAEKDYFLGLALKVLEGSVLFNKLIFKGGTAIHHCYLEQSRFSEDLDFGSLDRELKSKEVLDIFKGIAFFEVKKWYESEMTIKIERLKYEGVLDQANSLKFEIDFGQEVLLKAKEREYRNVWGIEVKVKVMDIREIMAEKLRAMSERARYRDFYDFYLILDKYRFEIEKIIELVSQKEIRKGVSKEMILRNWRITSEERKNEIDLVYYQDKIINEGNKIEKMINDFKFKNVVN